MLKLIIMLLAMLTILAIVTMPEDEKFLPPRIAHIQAVGCAAYADKDDMAAHVEVYAQHEGEHGWDYQVKIAQRDTAQAAFKDCAKWFDDLAKEFDKVHKDNK